MPTARLYDRPRKQLVAEVPIPHFTPPADVISWGERIFVEPRVGGYGELTYREGFVHVVIERPIVEIKQR